EAPKVALLEEAAQPGLDPGGRAQLGVPASRAAEVGCDVVRRLVRLDETVDIHVTDGLDSPDEIAHPVAVDREAQASLRLDLVALRDRDLTHVVADRGDPQAMGLVPAGGCPRPCAEAPRDH